MTDLERVRAALGPEQRAELDRGVARQMAEPYFDGTVLVPPRLMPKTIPINLSVRMVMTGCDVEMAILSLWNFKARIRAAARERAFGGQSIEAMTAELARRKRS